MMERNKYCRKNQSFGFLSLPFGRSDSVNFQQVLAEKVLVRSVYYILPIHKYFCQIPSDIKFPTSSVGLTAILDICETTLSSNKFQFLKAYEIR